MAELPHDLESDPRFPSGPWTGFWIQPTIPGRHMMELRLHFHDGQIIGTGRDRVGEFTFNGNYNLADGTCRWNKHYIGRHNVDYKGYNEGKGIWGVWQMAPELAPTANRGGFHIWPEGMADPTMPTLSEAAEGPAEVEELVTVGGKASAKRR